MPRHPGVGRRTLYHVTSSEARARQIVAEGFKLPEWEDKLYFTNAEGINVVKRLWAKPNPGERQAVVRISAPDKYFKEMLTPTPRRRGRGVEKSRRVAFGPDLYGADSAEEYVSRNPEFMQPKEKRSEVRIALQQGEVQVRSHVRRRPAFALRKVKA